MDRISKVIDTLNEKHKGSKGIFMYIPKEYIYVFIESTKEQRFNFACAKTPKQLDIGESVLD